MKNLVIVESPSKSKTIGKYLGKDYMVVSSKGHIRDLATRGKDGLGVDVDNDFAATYVISKDKKEIVKELKAEASKAKKVYLATDPDREGEAISWHLAQELGLEETDIDRVTFHEITKDAIQKAFEQPRTIDMDLVHSQEARRILDRIIGFKLSKLLQKKIRSKSAGRVQSVALKLIVEREKEIQSFRPEEYWTLEALFEKDHREFEAGLAKINGKKAKVQNAEEANLIYEACQGNFVVTEVKSSVRKREPKPAFITSTLQQEAATKLGFSPKRTMSIAQRLYEGMDVGHGLEGLITYMRTDSTRLSDVYRHAAKKKIESDYGRNYVGRYRVKNDVNSQDAHEAIRPTNVTYTPESIKEYLTSEQYKLYHLIYYRSLASLMVAAQYDSKTIILSQGDYDFSVSGSTLKFDGYLKAYGSFDSSKDVLLPEVLEGEEMKAKKLSRNQHFTEPPIRYTEAKLVKAMEEDGIGRPSTYATIIDTIVARGYVSLEKSSENSKTKVFKPSEQGVLTAEQLDRYFSSIINVKYTAGLESQLDEIADGRLDEVETLRKFYETFEPLLTNAYERMEVKELEKVGEECPLCGNELVYRNGRFGKFISCSTFPTCRYTRPLVEKEKEKPEPIGKVCPDCGGELVKRKSRFGTYFVGCSNYPKCRHMETLEGEPIELKKKSHLRKKKST